MTIQTVRSSTDFTMSATTDTLIGAMTITPGAGDYLAVFTMDFDVATVNAKNIEFSIYVNNAILQHTERRIDIEGSIATVGNRIMVCLTSRVQPTAGQTVEARYRVSADSATAKKRALTLFPKAAADFQQATGTSEVTVSSGTDTQVTGMTLTPGAGTYLLVYSTSATNVSAGSATNRIHQSVYVNAVQLAHTSRRLSAEASISALLGCMDGMIACIVTPTAGQVVEIRARRDGTTNWTIHERTLTLMKVETADIKEASQTADEADIGTTDELLVGMTLTDPGANDWLAIFSGSQTYGVIGAAETAIYSIYNAGSQDADSERQMTHDASIDDGDYYAYTHEHLTVAGATDDLTLRWRGSSATSRTSHQRTFVAVREAVAGLTPLTWLGVQPAIVDIGRVSMIPSGPMPGKG